MVEPTYELPPVPCRDELLCNWKTAIGLQAVDGLKTSAYLSELSNSQIDGSLEFDEVYQKLQSYYETRPATTREERNQKEADLVSERIAQLLADCSFTLSHIELTAIHRYLFGDIYDFAGQIRDFNISKPEWVLGGVSVGYGDARSVLPTLEYDIAQEKLFDYSALSQIEQIEHFARFIANIWQIHPFAEGNTRAIAVFAIKYLRKFGYPVGNFTFEESSRYFRNALVRANFSNLQNGIFETLEPLLKFLRNLLLSEENELRNSDLLVAP